MSSVAHLSSVLHALGQRARANDQKKGLQPAVGAVGDISRLLASGSEGDLRSLQSIVAGLREQLDGDDVANHPAKALAGPNSHSYLAGALWALNEAASARLALIDSAKALSSSATRRTQIRDAVLDALRQADILSPSEIIAALDRKELAARPDEISKALSALMSDGRIETATATSDGHDRRRRYFRARDGR